jgi:Spy/CpxP family protein refolding chaperone
MGSSNESASAITKGKRVACPIIYWEHRLFPFYTSLTLVSTRNNLEDPRMFRKSLLASSLLFCAASVFAQYAPQNPNYPMRPGRRGGGAPCLQQAGLDRSAVEQLRSIQHDARSQVEGVCSNSSLSPQQKRQQVQEIHQQAHQKIEGLITPEQQKALAACRQQHSGNRASGEIFEDVGGGCGEWQNGGSRPNGTNNGTPTGGNPPPASQSSPHD